QPGRTPLSFASGSNQAELLRRLLQGPTRQNYFVVCFRVARKRKTLPDPDNCRDEEVFFN
ncbi:MAG TPA: hypothetical protein PL029_09495, partial [Bacteroidia bacterium]|nr:hypothetical protein [Bacteroidia bacterium]